jgi:hypothetical protein
MSIFPANDIKKVSGDVEDKSTKYFHMKASWHKKS